MHQKALISQKNVPGTKSTKSWAWWLGARGGAGPAGLGEAFPASFPIPGVHLGPAPPASLWSVKVAELGCFAEKKKGKICRKGKSFAGRRAGSRAAQAAGVPEKHPDAAGPCPSTAASADGGKWDFNQREPGLLFPALRGLCCLSRGKGAQGELRGAQGHCGGTGGAQEGSALPVGPAWLQGWSQHPGKSHFTAGGCCSSFGMEHTGGKQPRAAPQGVPHGGEGKGGSLGHSGWLCRVPAPPRGPRVAAVPWASSEPSSEAVNP